MLQRRVDRPAGHDVDYPAARSPARRSFSGCSDVDAHMPKARVHESAAGVRANGRGRDRRIYPGMGHLVNEDEIVFARGLMDSILGVVS